MALAESADRGGLRAAIEGLLRTCVDLERHTDELARTSRDRVNTVARGLVGLRVPGLADLAHEIAGVGALMSADVSKALSEARAPYVAEVHRLLRLLAPLHGVPPVPPLAPPTGTVGGLTSEFPSGFARDYVTDILVAVEQSVTAEPGVAARAPVELQPAVDGVKLSVGASFAEVHRTAGTELLSDPGCHAVERHGPQIVEEAHLARLIWLKDPSGADAWHLASDGTVQTSHRCGVSAGGFTSPEALAKPIEAFLQAASTRVGGVDELLTNNTKKKVKTIGIHVSAEIAGLNDGDAIGYRGSGTGTPETLVDWLAARRSAIGTGRPAVYGVPYDPIGDGSDPGATLVFKRTGGEWRLVTCYPVGEQDPRNLRLEDLR